jgi:hypothetical protein
MEKCKKKSLLKTESVRYTSGEGGVKCEASYIIPLKMQTDVYLSWPVYNGIEKIFNNQISITDYQYGVRIRTTTWAFPKNKDKFNWETGKKVSLAKANVLVCKVVRHIIQSRLKYITKDLELLNKLEDFCPYFIDRELKYLKSV